MALCGVSFAFFQVAFTFLHVSKQQEMVHQQQLPSQNPTFHLQLCWAASVAQNISIHCVDISRETSLLLLLFVVDDAIDLLGLMWLRQPKNKNMMMVLIASHFRGSFQKTQ